MKIRFSQAWAKERYEKAIREAITFVKGSRACPDLLVKVFFYTNKGGYRGNYRNTAIHGSFNSDGNIQNIITLKFSNKIFYDPSVLTPKEQQELELKPATHGRMYRDRSLRSMTADFVSLFAHEFKHYLDMKALRDKMHFRHWEVRASKFEKKMVAQFLHEGEVEKNGSV